MAFLAASLVMLLSVAIAIAVDERQSSDDSPAFSRIGASAGGESLIVAHHGVGGELGQGQLAGTPAESAAAVAVKATQFDAGDREVIPAIQLEAARASKNPVDGNYRVPTGADTIQAYLDAARSVGAVLILDIRPGRARWINEVRRLRPFLEQPDVGLSLDPEWKVTGDQIPGEVVGSIDGRTINKISAYLGGIAVEKNLPDKLFIVSQFTAEMITDRDMVVERAGVRAIIDVNGKGDADPKRATYASITSDDGVLEWGVSIFPEGDTSPLTPKGAQGLSPTPTLVVYR